MPKAFAALATTGLALALCGASIAQTPSPTPTSPPATSFPAWAYLWAPDFKITPADDVPRHVPDSNQSFTVAQERDLFFVPDWHPEEHPAMPDVVAHGRMPDVRACGSCHPGAGPRGAGKRGPGRPTRGLYHPADRGLQKRRTEICRTATQPKRRDDGDRQGRQRGR